MATKDETNHPNGTKAMAKKQNKEIKDPSRKKGMGTLEQKKGKRKIYIARWTVDGKRYSKSTGTTIRAEAEKILADLVRPFQAKDKIKRLSYIKAEMEGVQAVLDEIDRNKPALKISDALERYFLNVNAEKVSDGTKKVYGDKFTKFERFIASRKGMKITELREITVDMANDFLASLQKEGLASTTYNSYLSFLRTMWRRLRKEAKLTTNIWEEFKKHKQHFNKRKNLTLDELRKVLQSTQGDWRTIWIIGYSTSLRVGDCANLKWASVNLDKNTITIIPAKTRLSKPEPITINIHPDLRKVLLSVRPSDRQGYVVPECAESYKRKSIYYRLKRILEKCGIVTNEMGENGKRICKRSFHSLRSMGATLMAEAGVPLLDICAQLNHSSVETTEGYLRKDQTRLSRCIDALPSIMGNGINQKTTIVLDSGVAELVSSKRLQNETLDECLKRIIEQAEKHEATGTNATNNYPLVPVATIESQNPFRFAS